MSLPEVCRVVAEKSKVALGALVGKVAVLTTLETLDLVQALVPLLLVLVVPVGTSPVPVALPEPEVRPTSAATTADATFQL